MSYHGTADNGWSGANDLSNVLTAQVPWGGGLQEVSFNTWNRGRRISTMQEMLLGDSSSGLMYGQVAPQPKLPPIYNSPNSHLNSHFTTNTNRWSMRTAWMTRQMTRAGIATILRMGSISVLPRPSAVLLSMWHRETTHGYTLEKLKTWKH